VVLGSPRSLGLRGWHQRRDAFAVVREIEVPQAVDAAPELLGLNVYRSNY